MKDGHVNYGTNTKQINYLVNDFDDFKQSSLTRIKQYFPDKVNLFAPDSDGDLFLQMHSRVGDILKFQLNQALNQSQLDTAVGQDSIFQLGKAQGFYNIKNVPAFGFVDITYTLSSSYIDNGTITATDYIPTIKRGSTISVNGQSYIINNDVIFVSDSSTAGNQNIVLRDDGDYDITMKDVFINRGSFQEFSFVVDQNQSMGKFFRIQLPRKNVTNIVYVQSGKQLTGNTGPVFENTNNLNSWTQYPFLAQRYIYKVINQNGVNKFIQIDTPYKYVIQYDKDGNTYLVFGPGRSFINNANNITAFKNAYAPITGYAGVSTQVISPQMFLYSSSLGYAPGDTNNKVMKVKYVYGGGVSTNVEANTQFTVQNMIFNNISSTAQANIASTMVIKNPQKIAGGIDSRNLQQVKQIIKRMRSSQNRIVNIQDYIRRIKARPNIYGGDISVNVVKQNGLTNVYLINKTYDNKVVQNISDSIKALNKTNLLRYLNKYTMLDQNFDITYRDIKNVVINFQFSLYDYQSKQNIQRQIGNRILELFSDGNVKLQVGYEIDFNYILDTIRNEFKAVRYMGNVTVYDKNTGTKLSLDNNVLSAVNQWTVYNIQDYYTDLTISVI